MITTPFSLSILRGYWPIALAVVLLPLWMYAIVPCLLSLPEDFHYSAQTVSSDNFYDEEKGGYSGEQASIGKFAYDVVGEENGILIVRNTFNVHKENGQAIFSVERKYGIDPRDKTHMAGYGDHNRSGYLFGPRLADKEDFTYWHVNYDSPAHMKFRGEEKINGLKVYRYQADYHSDQTSSLGRLPQVGVTRGINLDINLQIWIEPVSGWMVKYADQSTAYYYDLASGIRIAPWNHFSNMYAQRSVDEQVSLAQTERRLVLCLRYAVPAMIGMFGLVALLWQVFFRTRLRRYLTARSGLFFLMAVVPLASSIVFWTYASRGVEENTLKKFNQEVVGMKQAMVNRMGSYRNALENARALYNASEEVERDEWQRYVAAMQIDKNYQGMPGIAFLELVSDTGKAVHENKVRADGFPEYVIKPTGKRQEYTPITYIEPFTQSNRSILGLDTLSDPPRRLAMHAARDGNVTTLSGKLVPLVADSLQFTQSAFNLYVPVYRNGDPVSTPQERRKALIGYVMGGARVGTFINALFHGADLGVDFEIYDGSGEGTINNEHLMYSSLQRTKLLTSPRFQTVETVDLLEHQWTIVFSTVPGYGLGTFEEYVPTIILVVGCALFAFMLFVILSVRRMVGNTMSKRCPLVSNADMKGVPCRKA